MTIDSVTSTVSTSATGGSAVYNSSESVLGTDSFLQLLVAELQNQDPLDPQSSTEFISQLAQLSTVEQLDNVNNNLGVIQLYQNALNNATAVGYIGKMVQANGHAVEVTTAGDDTQLDFTLTENAADVSVDIYDSSGQLVRTIDAGELGAGEHSIDWDGTNGSGDDVAPGVYTFEVKAYDADGNQLETSAIVEGVVTGVQFKNGIPYLVTDEHLIALASVIKIVEAPEE